MTNQAEPTELGPQRSGLGRVVHSRAATIVFGSLWWLYGLWIAWTGYQARDADWQWLIYAGLCFGVFGGLLVNQVPWIFKRSTEVARIAGGVVVLGLAVAGLVASQPHLAVLIVVAMAGPALLAWLAERNARLQQRSDQLTQVIRLQDIHIAVLKHASHSAGVHMTLMRVNAELMKLAALEEVRRPASGSPVAGHRKRRKRVGRVMAHWHELESRMAEAEAKLLEEGHPTSSSQ